MTEQVGKVDHGPEHALERTMFFSDAVFAIAITLLIIEIHAPHLPHNADNQAWGAALIGLIPSFLAFALSFLVIGSVWAQHHSMMGLLARYHRRLLWPNLLLLMGVAFLPFSTGLIATGAEAQAPYAFYAVSLLIVALLKTRLVLTALQPDLLAPGVSAERVAVERRRAWVMPIAATIALLLTFLAAQWAMIGMALILVLRRLPAFRLPEE